MKLGMPILYEFNSIEENLILAKKLNLDFVELNLNFGYCRKEMEQKKVEELLKKYDLEATLHFYDEADFASYDEVVDAYFKLLEKYLELGKNYIKIMNFHNNSGPVVTISGVKNYIYEKEYDEYIVKLIHNFTKIKKLVQEANCKMVIENVDGAKGANFLVKSFKQLHEEGFHFNFDIGHDNIEQDYLYRLNEEINMKFDEFHFHDGNRKQCHLALGEGTIELKKYKDLAKQNVAYVLLEVKSSEDLIKSVPYFKNL